MTAFKYLRMTVTNENYIHEIVKNKLISFERITAPDHALQGNEH
jgi:hypothetical protein